MSAWPSGRLSNAIRLPSGDQRGVPVNAPPTCVSCHAARPSASLSQISFDPDRLERNTILSPSGEMEGLESYCVDEITFFGGAPDARSNRQMLVSSKNCAYTMRWPSRENEGSDAFSLTIGTRSV